MFLLFFWFSVPFICVFWILNQFASWHWGIFYLRSFRYSTSSRRALSCHNLTFNGKLSFNLIFLIKSDIVALYFFKFESSVSLKVSIIICGFIITQRIGMSMLALIIMTAKPIDLKQFLRLSESSFFNLEPDFRIVGFTHCLLRGVLRIFLSSFWSNIFILSGLKLCSLRTLSVWESSHISFLIRGSIISDDLVFSEVRSNYICLINPGWCINPSN